MGILYLDKSKDKAFQRALARFGEVSYASDINQALVLMADGDFHYYFIDADVGQSQALIRHLRHDPQLRPPRGVIILTDNDDEDCEAWAADTFLNRRTAVDELSYVFSHLKGDRSEPARILRIADFEPACDTDGQTDSVTDSDMGKAMPSSESIGLDPREHLRNRRRTEQQQRVSEARSGDGKARGGMKPWALRVALATLLLLGAAVWLFAWGPMGKKPSREQPGSSRKGVRAESQHKDNGATTLPTGYLQQTAPTLTQPQTAPADQPAVSPMQTETVKYDNSSEQRSEEAPTPAPAPPPAVNHAPSASISGPTQVLHGQAVSFSASASDPDGDPVSLSWTSKTMCWSTPGLYSLSVSVTDSRGASSADTISVRVI